jgi:hypothetical protein
VGAEDTRISYGDNNLSFHLLWVEKILNTVSNNYNT